MSKMKFTDCVDIVGSTPSEFMGNKIYVSTGALECEHINYNHTENITYNDRPSRANLSVNSGDILFAKMQGTKKSIIIDTDTSNHVYSTGFVAVHAKDDIISKECLYYLVTSECFLNRKDENCTGATQKAITNAGLDKIYINIPERVVQNRIVIKLDKITYIINACNSILEKVDLLVKAKFMEMFGDPVSNPMRWQTKPLLSIGKCKNGMNFHYDDNGVEINCLGVGDFKDLSIITDTSALPKISLNEMPTDEYLLKNNDIVFVRSNGNKALVGRSLIVYPDDIPTTFSGFCIRFRKDDDSVLIPYLLRVLKTDSIRKKMAGRGANIQNLNQQILSTLEIPVPPLELQQKFANFVEQTEKSKSAVKKVLEKAEMLKNALMQEYFV